MKLLSCRIENFGKLKDFTYYFEEDLSVLFAENGWGKSTFAAFLKVMFYGFDGENRRNEDGNERVRFRPWGGGVYGGSVTFTRGGRTYRVLRTFGSRKKDDTFALFDEETGLTSGDFSDRIGEELFGIDRESFRRTVFWSQSDHETAATTSIQAKIGGLGAQQDDLPAYDAAVKRLQREIERLRPDRASGLIRKKEDRLTVLEAEAARLPLLSAQLQECDSKEQALSGELADIRARRQQYALSVSEKPAVLTAADPVSEDAAAQKLAAQELISCEENLSRLLEKERRTMSRGRKEHREYIRVKKALSREQLEQSRLDNKRRTVLRAGGSLCLALSAIFFALCLADILPAPLLALPVLLLAGGAALIVRSTSPGSVVYEDEDLQKELEWHRSTLQALSRDLGRTRDEIREQRIHCESLRRGLKSVPPARDTGAPAAHALPDHEAAAQQSGMLSLKVREALSDYDRQEEACRSRLQDVRRQSAELSEAIGDCKTSAALLPQLKAEIKTLRGQYDTCIQTLSYLEQARNSFTSRYMNPFLRSFGRYYSMLTGESADSVRTDADFSIRVMDGGLPRDPSLLSEGSRDLISLCRRMAMIDAMYPGEKPFLVLDDPFSNLDDERVKGGLRFLHSASLEYQILYLTCHKSRF